MTGSDVGHACPCSREKKALVIGRSGEKDDQIERDRSELSWREGRGASDMA
jgi:hypothetical protein